MNRKNIYKFLYLISAFLIIGFCIRLGVDYFKYDITKTSAPFDVIILERTLEFVIPSIVIFIVAIVMKRYIK